MNDYEAELLAQILQRNTASALILLRDENNRNFKNVLAEITDVAKAERHVAKEFMTKLNQIDGVLMQQIIELAKTVSYDCHWRGVGVTRHAYWYVSVDRLNFGGSPFFVKPVGRMLQQSIAYYLIGRLEDMPAKTAG